MEAMRDYVTHRLLIVGSTRDLKALDRVVDWKELADAKDIALVDRSAGRRLWQFVTPAPAMQSLRVISREWPRLTFFLHYDCEDARIVALVRAKNGRLRQHCRFKY